ncbi:hypothetical protein D3C84_616020 [compost metagenome]
MSQGSAISLTRASTGSAIMALKKALMGSNSPASRARVTARSKRKPSTCISVTQ